MHDPKIITTRLQLSALRKDDAAAMYAYRSDPMVCHYQSFEPGSLQDVDAFIQSLQGNTFNKPDSWFQMAIRLRATEQLVGDMGLHFSADDGRQVEIGFSISPAFQRQGFATEALLAVIDHLFCVLHKHRIFASVDPRNAASLALLERVGMRREAHFRQSLWFKGEWADDMVFALLASEWQA